MDSYFYVFLYSSGIFLFSFFSFVFFFLGCLDFCGFLWILIFWIEAGYLCFNHANVWLGMAWLSNEIIGGCVRTVRTCALVGSNCIDAYTAVLTRITGTFVDIDLALFARPACSTQTKERRLLFKSLLGFYQFSIRPPFLDRQTNRSDSTSIRYFHSSNIHVPIDYIQSNFQEVCFPDDILQVKIKSRATFYIIF